MFVYLFSRIFRSRFGAQQQLPYIYTNIAFELVSISQINTISASSALVDYIPIYNTKDILLFFKKHVHVDARFPDGACGGWFEIFFHFIFSVALAGLRVYIFSARFKNIRALAAAIYTRARRFPCVRSRRSQPGRKSRSCTVTLAVYVC